MSKIDVGNETESTLIKSGETKQLNIDTVAERQNVTVENTTTTLTPLEEMQSQLRIKEADAKYKRIKELILILVGLIMMISVVGFCIWVILRENSTPDEKKIAFGIVGLIVSTFLGYITGRESKGKE